MEKHFQSVLVGNVVLVILDASLTLLQAQPVRDHLCWFLDAVAEGRQHAQVSNSLCELKNGEAGPRCRALEPHNMWRGNLVGVCDEMVWTV